MTGTETASEFGADYQDQLEQAQGSWWVSSMHAYARRLLGPVSRSCQVLDSGCGSGATLHWLSELVDRSVGLDVSLPGLARSQRAAPRSCFLAASAVALPFSEDEFDLVVSTDVLQHLRVEERHQAIAETARVLRPGGRALFRTNVRSLRGGVVERDDWHLIDPSALRHELQNAGLRVERMTHANAAGAFAVALGSHRQRTHGGDLAHENQTATSAVAGSAPDPGHGLARGIGIPRPRARWIERTGTMIAAAERSVVFRLGIDLPIGHTLFVLAQRPGNDRQRPRSSTR